MQCKGRSIGEDETVAAGRGGRVKGDRQMYVADGIFVRGFGCIVDQSSA